LVRDFNDNDNNKVVFEQWRGLSLDVSNPRFIGNIIGDTRVFYNFDASTGKQKLTTTGNYPVRSKYIRVSIADDVINGETPESALPMGCRGFPHLATSGSAPFPALSDSTTWTVSNPLNQSVQPPVPFRTTLARGASSTVSTDRSLYWGVQFERQDSAIDPNSSYAPSETIKSLTKYFASYHTDWMNPIISGNEGASDTSTNGIVDADRFNNNAFSLENIKVVYDATSGLADVTNLDGWSYVRTGVIPSDSVTHTRALTVDDLTDPSVKTVAKFTVYLQGGFDGTRIFNADTAQLTNKAIVEEMNYTLRGFSSGPTVTSYTKALQMMNDTMEVDIQLLTLPGIRHRFVTDTALRVTENRFDAMLIFDIEERDTSNALVTTDTQNISVGFTAADFGSRGLNSSFGAAYFPDVALRDQFNRSVVRVPPSVAVLGAFSKNDAVAYPWFAPAGFARGALETTNDPIVRLSKTNMDALYAVNINPIVSFAGSTGPVVWGQKTVLARQSSLDRVNVRRLLISLRRQVRRVANKILFEQNKEATLTRFSQLVNPIFKLVQDQQGIDNYKVVIDTTTTTQADVENKTIRGKIFLVPTKTLEFLSIDFVLTNRGNFVNG
jgi:phage tail sheath protein FI